MTSIPPSPAPEEFKNLPCAAVAFDVDDLDALKTVLSSVPPEMAAQAESHGVIVSTMTAYVQA